MDTRRKPSKTTDVFGDFLKSMKDVNAGPPAVGASREKPPTADVPQQERSQEARLELAPVLTYLRTNDDQTLPELAAGLGSPILQTAEFIKQLAVSGVVDIHGDPGDERVALTDAGRSMPGIA